jgi:hypothetical protein
MQQHDIEFDANGTTLRGWLCTPDHGAGPFPAVVMAHGFSAVKEMGLDCYASVFADAGIASLVYDNRNLGASDGEPRTEIDPVAQMRDYRHAVTHALTRPEIDGARIGAWGTSYTGGLAIIAAALDRRIRCVVSQVPFISGWQSMEQVMPLEGRAAFFRMLEEDRAEAAAGRPAGFVTVCTDDPEKPYDAPGRASHRYFTSFTGPGTDRWRNEVTTRSLDLRLEYETMPYVSRVSPTPLLMIVATSDTITPTEIALEAYASAREPKRLVLMAGNHYDPYLEGFDRSSAEARNWFLEHLGAAGSVGRS